MSKPVIKPVIKIPKTDLNSLSRTVRPARLAGEQVDKYANLSRRQARQLDRVSRADSKRRSKEFRAMSKEGRKNLAAEASEKIKLAQIRHGTIRQGLVELGGMGMEGIASNAISKSKASPSALIQNLEGGTDDRSEDSDNGGGTMTEIGPVYSISVRGRKEG